MDAVATGDGERERAAVRRAVDQLAKVMGSTQAEEVMRECLTALGLVEVSTADELRLVADRLIASGGFVAVIGGSLRVQAILAGAQTA